MLSGNLYLHQGFFATEKLLFHYGNANNHNELLTRDREWRGLATPV
jgi:hypothetical protein